MATARPRNPTGAGVYIEAADGPPAEELFEALGKPTNNVAEYSALLLALTRAQERGASEVTISSDSLLLVEQVHGNYKVKAIHLKPLHAEAVSRARRFRRFAIRHIPREENKKADRLANLGADASERARDRALTASAPEIAARKDEILRRIAGPPSGPAATPARSRFSPSRRPIPPRSSGRRRGRA